jgi:hypothetical protein
MQQQLAWQSSTNAAVTFSVETDIIRIGFRIDFSRISHPKGWLIYCNV